jgi:tetratricopeptide (TPR) repeat protein
MSRIAGIVRTIVLATIVGLPSAPLAAQRLGPPPPRPKGAVADTNDAMAYLEYGNGAFDKDPTSAASAFYWAARIDPSLAEPLYARRAALLMTNPGLRATFIDGGRRARESKQLRALDSLYLRALNLNPLVYRRLDRRLLTAHIVETMERNLRQSGTTDVTRGEIDFFVEGWLKNSGTEFRGWIAYGDGNFTDALQYYAKAMKETKFKAGLRIERGRIFGMLGQLDSAVAELRLALTEMRSKDTKDLVFFYDSKALFEHTVATLLEQQGDLAGAREGYGKALQEDLAFYPAHLRLGMLALGQADTAAALSELELAAQIAGDEPFVRYVYGYALGAATKYPEAVEQLKKSVELEPYFALPQAMLGQIYERQGDGKNAQAAYTTFLARARQREPQRAFVTQRLKEVNEALGITPKQ